MSAPRPPEDRMRGYRPAQPVSQKDEMTAKLEELSRLQLEADRR